ncbi:MAG: aldo/keto reductase [Promicromonosporaceae bacterium]|nr:aldo/keto reductase [Promicromonosporaceae bacterium]
MSLKVPQIPLNNGVEIPQLGLGTYKVEAAQGRALVRQALELGYRHIDTAAMYRNEREVGQGISDSGLSREEIFLTTKLNNAYHRHDDALAAFERSLQELGTDYVDLYLIHWPLPMYGLYSEAWGALEEIYASGRARAIGVSNFQPAHLETLAETGTITPAVNQVEVNPYFVNAEVTAYNQARGIVTEAWSPLGRAAVLGDPRLAAIAATHGKSPAQVALRWHLQQGFVVFPKSSHPERLAQNADVFDFELTPQEMGQITALDRDQRSGTHPDLEDRLDR